MSGFSDVGDFHHKFGLPYWNNSSSLNTNPIDQELMDFRVNFMQEELVEFMQALADKNHAEMFDALLDLVYVALGTAHLLNYPWPEGWKLVQHANMQKIRASSAEESLKQTGRGHAADVCKPLGWTPPDIQGLLKKHGF